MCHGREREAPGARILLPSLPPLYIGPRERGGAALALPPRKGAAREESILPKAPRRCFPPLGLSPPLVPLAHGPLGAGALGPYRPRRTPYSPCGPLGTGGPTRWTPGTLPVVPVQYRRPRNLSRWPKQDFLYINLYLRTIPELLVTSGISSGTPNNFRVTAY